EGEANRPAAATVDALSTSRLENGRSVIVSSAGSGRSGGRRAPRGLAVSAALQSAKCLPSSWVIAGSWGEPREHERYTPTSLLYRALISSLDFSTAAGSSFIFLISPNGFRPGLSLACGCNERNPPKSIESCCACGEKQKLWNSRAAFGLGAFLNSALGPTMSGEPSVA